MILIRILAGLAICIIVACCVWLIGVGILLLLLDHYDPTKPKTKEDWKELE